MWAADAAISRLDHSNRLRCHQFPGASEHRPLEPSEKDSTVRAMRLLVARCEVLYTGRLTARLPDAVRLLMFKADGSFLVHDDAGGFRPLNWRWSVFRHRATARAAQMPRPVRTSPSVRVRAARHGDAKRRQPHAFRRRGGSRLVRR